MKKFEASRLTQGNKLFPTQVILTNKSLVIKQPGIFKTEETTIPYYKITFIKVNIPLIGFSSVSIGTENQPIQIDGFTKSQVKEIQSFVLEMI